MQIIECDILLRSKHQSILLLCFVGTCITRRCGSLYLGVGVQRVWYFEHALLQLNNCHHILPEKINPLLHLFAEPHSLYRTVEPRLTTTSLLRPYFFDPNVKITESFYYYEDPVNATALVLRPGFYGPTVVALTRFHCMSTQSTTKIASFQDNVWKYGLQHRT